MSEPDKTVKIPPHSKESEMMVLGCMLTSINSLNVASDLLDEADFYHTEHRLIFQVLKLAYCQDKPADIHLVAEELKRQDKLKEVGGVAYLTTLAQYAGTSAYIDEYAEIIKDKAILRRMIHASQKIERRALDEPDDVAAALDEAQQSFFQISQTANPMAGKLLVDILQGPKAESKIPFLKEVEEKQTRYQLHGPQKGVITGLPTHFNDLDKMINGLNPSNLMILAARPAMGKTALAINIAESVCFKHNVPVGVFSLEMSADQLVQRIVSSQSDVESEKIKTGALNGHEYQQVLHAVTRMQQHTLIIDDQPGLKITDLRARARRMKESWGIQLLIIDYLQLLTGSASGRGQENRQNEVSEISRMLKNLARELNVPVLCLSQLSRKVEERPGHRPMMSDLRESGCLNGDTLIQDAETGQLHTIRSLAERPQQDPISVFAVDENLKVSKHSLVKAFYSGRKVVYHLKLRSGRSIKASANHPFLKLEGWTRLDQLKIGDRLAVPREVSAPESEPRFKKAELTLLAHLLGDGCILPKQPYHYTSQDQENLQAVSLAAKELFNIDARIVVQKNWFHLYLKNPFHAARGKLHPITYWFNELGLERVRSYDKKMPEKLFLASSQEVSHFLHHLWATDGNISKSLNPNKSATISIYYSSSSLKLSEQVQHLLLRLGIRSVLRVSNSKKGYGPMYAVAIQGATSQIKFLREVGCHGDRGKQIPQFIQHLEGIKENPNIDVIPKEVWSLVVDPIRKEKKLSWREICAGLNISYCGSTLFKAGISKERIKKVYRVLPSPEIEKYIDAGVFWDEVLSIEMLGEEDVYDATVEGVHNFVANDIFVHNSLEQDADVVMFLLRRDYYDANDKPGQAELIIAKNRHGAIGSVHLAYRKELAQFANLTHMAYQPNYAEAY